eukprot:m.31471 g.31471  ORF g.31471 m.31471 type:complete len:167 (+) comp31497_c0_seq1:56-556(+)
MAQSTAGQLVLVTAENTTTTITKSENFFPIDYVSAYSTQGLWIIYSEANHVAKSREKSAIVNPGTGQISLLQIQSAFLVDQNSLFQVFFDSYYSLPGPAYSSDSSDVEAKSLLVMNGTWNLFSEQNYGGVTTSFPATPALEYATLTEMGFAKDVKALRSIKLEGEC